MVSRAKFPQVGSDLHGLDLGLCKFHICVHRHGLLDIHLLYMLIELPTEQVSTNVLDVGSGSKLPLRALIEKVYRGLFLADGEGLDVMEANREEHGHIPEIRTQSSGDLAMCGFATYLPPDCRANFMMESCSRTTSTPTSPCSLRR